MKQTIKTVECPICEGKFKEKGLTLHMAKAHFEAEAEQIASEVVNQTKKITKRQKVELTKLEDSIPNISIESQIPIELIAYTIGKIESTCSSIASQHDIPDRVFAKRCAEYFSIAANR